MGVVIADAGPLIGLARIGHLDLLRALFGGVSLTPGVAAEIGFAAPCWLVPWIQWAPWLSVCSRIASAIQAHR